MSGECVVGVQRLNFVGDDFHLFLSGLIRYYVFVILLSLSSLVVLGNLMVRMCWHLSQEFEAPNYFGVEIR